VTRFSKVYTFGEGSGSVASRGIELAPLESLVPWIGQKPPVVTIVCPVFWSLRHCRPDESQPPSAARRLRAQKVWI